MKFEEIKSETGWDFQQLPLGSDWKLMARHVSTTIVGFGDSEQEAAQDLVTRQFDTVAAYTGLGHA